MWISILKSEITGKHSEKIKKQLTKNQNNTPKLYKPSGGPIFTFSLPGGVRSTSPRQQTFRFAECKADIDFQIIVFCEVC